MQFSSKLFSKVILSHLVFSMEPAEPKPAAPAQPKSNRQGRPLGSGTVSNARRERRLAQFAKAAKAEGPALEKAWIVFLTYLITHFDCRSTLCFETFLEQGLYFLTNKCCLTLIAHLNCCLKVALKKASHLCS